MKHVRLSRAATVVSRLLPSSERDAIVGDLLEDAAYRDPAGTGRTLWLCAECGQIAAGIAVERMRGTCAPPLREMATAVALESSRTFRHARGGPVGALVSILLFCASAVLIALSATVLIGTLLTASYR
jgi:hypothetical protein